MTSRRTLCGQWNGLMLDYWVESSKAQCDLNAAAWDTIIPEVGRHGWDAVVEIPPYWWNDIAPSDVAPVGLSEYYVQNPDAVARAWQVVRSLQIPAKEAMSIFLDLLSQPNQPAEGFNFVGAETKGVGP